VDTDLVLVPVTVSGAWGAPFPDLTSTAFQIFGHGVEQRIKYFTPEGAPVSVGIVSGPSGMEVKLDQSRAAVPELFDTSVPGDEFIVVEVGGSPPRLLCGFTRDTQGIARHWLGCRPFIGAIYMTAPHLRYARNARGARLIVG
jgi:hypothetical protein